MLDQRAEKRFEEARTDAWVALATGDQDGWAKSDEAMKVAESYLDSLAKTTKDPDRQARVRQWIELVQNYKQAASAFRSIHGQNDALNAPEAKAATARALKISADIANLSRGLSDEYEAAANLTSPMRGRRLGSLSDSPRPPAA